MGIIHFVDLIEDLKLYLIDLKKIISL